MAAEIYGWLSKLWSLVDPNIDKRRLPGYPGLIARFRMKEFRAWGFGFFGESSYHWPTTGSHTKKLCMPSKTFLETHGMLSFHRENLVPGCIQYSSS